MLEFSSQEIEYPTSDGEPMGETDLHREQILELITTFEDRFADDPNTYVSGNILLYYVEGDARKHISPDVLVVRDLPRRKRDTYLLWEEGKAPDLVIEVTSKSTRSEDLGNKKGLYAFLGVKEYVLFDPRREYLEPRLRLFRLAGEDYLPVVGRLYLETVGLELATIDDKLRLVDPETRAVLATRRERNLKLAEENIALADEKTRLVEQTRSQEEELARLRAELKRLQDGQQA